MELEKFIAESLESIAKGIDKANEKLMPNGICVNPFEDGMIPIGKAMCKVNQVNFDVAVTVSKQADTEGKISVFSVGGIGGNIVNASEQVSRLSFSLRMAIPVKDLE